MALLTSTQSHRKDQHPTGSAMHSPIERYSISVFHAESPIHSTAAPHQQLSSVRPKSRSTAENFTSPPTSNHAAFPDVCTSPPLVSQRCPVGPTIKKKATQKSSWHAIYPVSNALFPPYAYAEVYLSNREKFAAVPREIRGNGEKQNAEGHLFH